MVVRIFDWLFVDQLFRTNDRGETVFYPNGSGARGYLVPSDRKSDVRSGVRRLAFTALVGVFTLAVVVPDQLERWISITLPLPWFIGGAVVMGVVGVGAVIHSLSRLAAGLEPAPP